MNDKLINGIEIMAPAGSYESLHAAINAGAGSIYFGVGNLNMRSKSTYNFTLEDLENIANMCNADGIKTYLTVNTVIYDHDITEMQNTIRVAKKSGITAIIASDLATIQFARSIDMEVHISTQINISNIESLEFYSAYADVVVLARELNLDQVRYIYDEIQKRNIRGPKGELIKIEIFIHGALCMAISGKCYLSLHENTRSANRGACLQNCRRSYIVKEKESDWELEIDNEYIMSPKDLCTINFLDKVIEAGAEVLKIEGRGRAADYVKRTIEIYREAVTAYFAGEYTPQNIEIWVKKLSTVYNRGFWDGYYLGRKLGEWSERYGSKATKKKVQVGRVTNYFTKAGVAEIWIQSEDLGLGDDFLIIGPTTGAYEDKISEIRLDNQPKKKVKKGNVVSIPVKEKVRKQDKVFKIIDDNGD